MERNVAIEVEQVGKTYHLGTIGGTTLQAQFQSWWARLRHREDPNRRIGRRQTDSGEFQALKKISFQVREGERVGIIGRNGAGKSTLLKLISRIAAPTQGRILLKGRVSSMLEVGAGFHGELTGRENIYLNGAILGMKQAEIDEKIQQIIEFSECEKFIDTPVKRYSSGMYVKLAFSVAAHLDADLFLMDEVLAVGDMLFQKKCLKKMREISENENKTILYVSHNMQTVRELCDRVIVLEDGNIVHDGDVEDGIRIYMKNILEVREFYEFSDHSPNRKSTGSVRLKRIHMHTPVLGGEEGKLVFTACFSCLSDLPPLHIRFTVHDEEDAVVGTSISHPFRLQKGEEQQVEFVFDADQLIEGLYSVDLVVIEPQGDNQWRHEYLERAIAFRVDQRARIFRMGWNSRQWGKVRFPEMEARRVEK